MTLFALMFACSTPEKKMMEPTPDATAAAADHAGGDKSHDGHAGDDHAADGHGGDGHAKSDHGADGKAADGHDHAAGGVPPMAPAPEGAAVMFGALKDGAEVASPVKVVMKVQGMTVQPAGEPKAGTGHHHLIIDGAGPEMGMAVPADATHIHFGKGQTEAEVELAPGEHILTLQFADGLHRSYGPALSKTVKVTVTP